MEPTATKLISKEDKKFARLSISVQDFQICVDYLREIERHEYGSLVREALLSSAIIAYARPFSNNEIKNAAKSEARLRVAEFQLNEWEQEFHELVITLRKKAIAHSEWDYYPTSAANNLVITSVPFSIWKYFKDTDIAMFIELSAHMTNQAHNLRADIMRKKRLGVD